MRIDKFILSRNINDPKTLSGSHGTFLSGHLEKTAEDYDLYLINDTAYIVRDNMVAIVTSWGVAYLRGEEGERKAESLATKFPRPTKEEK